MQSRDRWCSVVWCSVIGNGMAATVLAHSSVGSNCKRFTRVAGASCHSVGVAAVEEKGLGVKQVCWLAGFSTWPFFLILLFKDYPAEWPLIEGLS